MVTTENGPLPGLAGLSALIVFGSPIGDSAPVVGSIENIATVLLPMFAAYRNLPIGSIASEIGDEAPVDMFDSQVSSPAASMLNSETIPLLVLPV